MDEVVVEPTQDERDRFQTWLAHMGNFLDDYRTTVPPAFAPKLAFSVASLDAVESYILDLYPTMDPVIAPSSARMVNLLSVYAGEAIRENGGGS